MHRPDRGGVTGLTHAAHFAIAGAPSIVARRRFSEI